MSIRKHYGGKSKPLAAFWAFLANHDSDTSGKICRGLSLKNVSYEKHLNENLRDISQLAVLTEMINEKCGKLVQVQFFDNFELTVFD